jgi:hypothetical protein
MTRHVMSSYANLPGAKPPQLSDSVIDRWAACLERRTLQTLRRYSGVNADLLWL